MKNSKENDLPQSQFDMLEILGGALGKKGIDFSRWKKKIIKMSYFKHLKINIKAMFKCLILALFHIAHGILPIKLTEHKRWGIGEKDE